MSSLHKQQELEAVADQHDFYLHQAQMVSDRLSHLKREKSKVEEIYHNTSQKHLVKGELKELNQQIKVHESLLTSLDKSMEELKKKHKIKKNHVAQAQVREAQASIPLKLKGEAFINLVDVPAPNSEQNLFTWKEKSRLEKLNRWSAWWNNNPTQHSLFRVRKKAGRAEVLPKKGLFRQKERSPFVSSDISVVEEENLRPQKRKPLPVPETFDIKVEKEVMENMVDSASSPTAPAAVKKQSFASKYQKQIPWVLGLLGLIAVLKE